MTKTMAVLAALLLGLTACSGGSSGDEKKAADSLSKVVLDNSNAGSGFKVDQTGAECIGKGLVDEFGTDRLVELGFLTKDLEAPDSVQISNLKGDDAKKFVDAFTSCVDVAKMIIDAIEKDPTFAALPDTIVKCIEGAVTEDAAKAVLLDQFTGSTEGQDALRQALTTCVPQG